MTVGVVQLITDGEKAITASGC